MKKLREMFSVGSWMLLVITLSATTARTQISAVRTEEKPVIDGVIEELWQKGTPVSSFKQIQPDILADATVKTEASFLYDNENVYVAMKLFQPKKTVRSSKGRRDSDLIKDGDYVTFAVDPLNNGNTAFFFTVNPDDGVRDGTINEYGTEDTQWDATIFSATAITDEYWTVELQIPLTSLSFQNKDAQDWKFRFYRRYAQNQELVVSRLSDINNPLQLTNFETLTGLNQLNKNGCVVLTPYGYSQNQTDFLQHSSVYQGKAGGEVRYMPSSTTTVLATVNPDYAQIETDKEIINVSDLPTTYPEKRPFFTESSDFYTNAAVYTRNIADIKAGVKVRHLGDWMKYDMTSVLDDEDNVWLMGHGIAGDNTSYMAEVTSGLKNQKARNDYNITTHAMAWFFDKRLAFSNWIGTINKPDGGKNEWETVNTWRWLSRNFNLVWWSHYKTQLYNPNVLGWNYLSNEYHSMMWTQYTIINGSGTLRSNALKVSFDYYDLTSPHGQSYSTLTFTQDNTLHFGEGIGNWTFSFVYMPPIKQKFRYRNIDKATAVNWYEDAFSPFILVDDRATSFATVIQSDISKNIGCTLSFDNNHVRQSRTENMSSEVYVKIGSDAMIRYSLGYINIHGSAYQSRYERVINRLQVEYNVTDKFNVRLILQPDIARLPGNYDYVNNILASNLTVSWEYLQGSYIYFVYSNYRNQEETNIASRSMLRNDQSFILKINRSITL